VFAAATSVNRAGYSTEPTARVTTTRPSSSAWRQPFHRVAPELRDLVEEQHAVMRQRDLAGTKQRAVRRRRGLRSETD
jgi:hypothetical protein